MLSRFESIKHHVFLKSGFSLPGRILPPLTGQRGFSLPELLITMTIFSVLMTGVFSAYFSQIDHSTREYKVAESEIELGIARRIIEQDLQMSGYGLADVYPTIGANTFDPIPVAVANGPNDTDSDALTLMGTALGQLNRGSQGWSYISGYDTSIPAKLNIKIWNDAREDIEVGDRVVLIEPNSKNLLINAANEWLFRYTDTAGITDIVSKIGTSYSSELPAKGVLVYGLYSSSGDDNESVTNYPNLRPYYAVRYYLGDTGDTLGSCAPGTSSLLRGESVRDQSPIGQPLLACVLDFQTAYGLDTNGSGTIDNWTDLHAVVNGLSRENMSEQLKRIKVYVLVQSGNRDRDYTYPLSTVRVGEGSLGREITLTAEQRKYRWRLVSLSVQPRNVR